jgi:Abnormal spindle-like microcephaly-assoc'd, ASPM-SPD-2-Hydin
MGRLIRSFVMILMAGFITAGAAHAQAPWPGQSGNPVGFAASPTWTGSFNATACPSSPASGTSWANATIIQNCTYTGANTFSCNYCEFIDVDFNGGAVTNNNTVGVAGDHQMYIGDRFQSNDVISGNVADGHAYTYFFYDSFQPAVAYYISPPGTGCRNSTVGNIGCTNWPSGGAGANSTTIIEETGFTPGSTTPSNANAINGNKGYEYGLNIDVGGGPIWMDSCDIWGFGDAIVNQTTTAQITITNTWMHDAANPTEQAYHTDGYGYSNGNTAPNNVLLTGNATGILGNTQALALQAATGGYQNIYINENFFSGDGATIAFCQPGSVQCTNSTFYGNTWSATVAAGGSLYAPGAALGSGTVWACNRVNVPSGTTRGGWSPSVNGEYFVNNATVTNSTTDHGSNTLCGITTPASYNFGTQAVNTTSAGKTITLYSTNTGNLSISSIALASGTQFSVTSNTCGSALNSGSNCSITVKFSPTSLGPQTDTLRITDNTPGVSSPQLVPLAGIGTAASLSSVAPPTDLTAVVN